MASNPGPIMPTPNRLQLLAADQLRPPRSENRCQHRASQSRTCRELAEVGAVERAAPLAGGARGGARRADAGAAAISLSAIGLRDRWDIPVHHQPAFAHPPLYLRQPSHAQRRPRRHLDLMLSGDLTRNIDRETIPVMGKVWGPDAVGKNLFTDSYGTGTAIDESPLKEGLLMLGTDDGLIQISEDGGATWRKIDKFPGIPDLTYVSWVFPSPSRCEHFLCQLQRFPSRQLQTLHPEDHRLRPHLALHRRRSARCAIPSGRVIQDPRERQSALRRNRIRTFILGRWRRALGPDQGRHAHHQHPGASRSSAARATCGCLIRPRLLCAGRYFRPAPSYSSTLAQEGALFPVGRRARQFTEIGYYSAAGEPTDPNPPMGALLTYYLREALPGELSRYLQSPMRTESRFARSTR